MAGHPDAHEAARVLARDARVQKKSLAQMLKETQTLDRYLRDLSPEQRAVLDDPAKYQGVAAERTRALCDEWEKRLAALEGR
jgi:hypothetical protein